MGFRIQDSAVEDCLGGKGRLPKYWMTPNRALGSQQPRQCWSKKEAMQTSASWCIVVKDGLCGQGVVAKEGVRVKSRVERPSMSLRHGQGVIQTP